MYSPQLPCAWLSPFRALAKLLASSLTCLLSSTSCFISALSVILSVFSSLYAFSTFSENSVIRSRSGVRIVSKLVLFWSVNFCVFSSRILLAMFSNSVVYFLLMFSNSSFSVVSFSSCELNFSIDLAIR